MRCAAAWGSAEIKAETIYAELMEVAGRHPAVRRPGLAAARRAASGRSAHPVRGRAGRAARQRPRHLSVRHLVQHRRRTGGGGLRARADGHRLCAGNHQGLHDAGGRGAVPVRALRRHRQASLDSGQGGRGQHRAAAALRLVRFRARPADRKDLWHNGNRAHQARRARRPEEIKVCVGYELNGSQIDYLPASMGAQAGVTPIYETLEGWSQTTARRTKLGRFAGPGRQVCPAHRRTDRCARRHALHQPGTARIPYLSMTRSKIEFFWLEQRGATVSSK